MPRSPVVLAVALAIIVPSPALPSLTPQQKCASTIELLSGSFLQCRLKAEATFTKKADAAKLAKSLTKCSDSFTTKFNNLVTKLGCPVTEKAAAFEDTMTECTDAVATAAPGGTFPLCESGTSKQIVFELTASSSLQGLQFAVSYPVAKGSFAGSGDLVECLQGTPSGSFAKNDQENGTLLLSVVNSFFNNQVPLSFPSIITCTFNVTAGTMSPADLAVTVQEVTVNGSVGNPAALTVMVSIP